MGWMEDMLGGIGDCAKEFEDGVAKSIDKSFEGVGLRINETFSLYMGIISTEYKNVGKKLLEDYKKTYEIIKTAKNQTKDSNELRGLDRKIDELTAKRDKKQDELKVKKEKQEERLKNRRDAYIRKVNG
jgi:hypothetical protein